MNIKGDKIVVRNWLDDDFEAYKHWNIGNYEWMKYNGPYYPLKTKTEIAAAIDSLRSGQNTRSKVIADVKTNQLLGSVSWYWQSIETNWMSIGIAIYDENFWGHGIGFEALAIWTQYLFQEKKEIVRLDLRTWSGNKGMMKLAEKLGYTEEARFRKARIVNGKYFDSLAYGILREEWELQTFM